MTGDLTKDLNREQLQAVRHGETPLLIIAGAGTGKTRTLVHRVAYLIAQGTTPERILLLTFTRRAAAEMLRRLESLLRTDQERQTRIHQIWGGTFHAVGTRLLRIHGKSIGLEPGFTVLDRSDAEDLLDIVRTERKLSKSEKRFPKKGTCLAIYSSCVNSRRPLADVLKTDFPWCDEFEDELKGLFSDFVDRKEQANALDYDDLLLFWHALLEDSELGDRIRKRFECILVDEYQDTNRLQAEILQRLSPNGTGLTVVGDDAQAIYSFRAATVRNIREFLGQFPTATKVVLEENYRSTPEILDTTNRVLAETREGYAKTLWSQRPKRMRPKLVYCDDEDEQASFVIERILEHREGGLKLKDQAVLFRTSHHSTLLEAELARRKIPFVKFGGLKFIEAAHVKDMMAFLRLADNPRDVVAGCRVLTLLPGIGPQRSRSLMNDVVALQGFQSWRQARVPEESKALLTELGTMLDELRETSLSVAAQVGRVLRFYRPLLEEKYDNVEPRLRELEQLEHLASRFTDRLTMLTEFALDPPHSSNDFAGEPLLDEDYLILSTIHSAKGLEWRVVYTIHAADGYIPSDMATRNPEQIEEERRLFYVALTRAKDALYVCCPHRYYHLPKGPRADRHGYAQLSRFITRQVQETMDTVTVKRRVDESHDQREPHSTRSVRAKIKSMWK